jgi:hypothetical protein
VVSPRFGLIAFVAATVLLLVHVLAGTAQAEPEVSVLSCRPSELSSRVNTDVTVTCLLVDQFGQGVPNTPLTFYFNFESKTDARWGNGLKTQILSTDARGIANATLSTGPEAGSMGVLVNFPGIYSSFTVLQVERPPELTPPPPSGEGMY